MAGRAAAINAMCKQCIYDPYQRGNWRQQVEACTRGSCPLYEFRPKSSTGAAISTDPLVGQAHNTCASQAQLGDVS